MKIKLLLLFLFQFYLVSSQTNELYVYPEPASEMVRINPSVIPKIISDTIGCNRLEDYKVGKNTDFTVHVKKGTATSGDPYIRLFEYNTFVNSSSGDLSKVTRSSFVTFDYTGIVTIKIKCNFAELDVNRIAIRPLSRGIVPNVISYNEFTITLNNNDPLLLSPFASDKLSIEINGNRYSNLQIFANRKLTETPIELDYNLVYSASNNGTLMNQYNEAFDNTPKKILIKAGAIVTVPYDGPTPDAHNGTIILNNNDEIFFEQGAILNGGLMLRSASNVKIRGRGIIDLTNYPKKYSGDDTNDYASVQAVTIIDSKNITFDGIVINDSQQLCVEMTDSGGTTADSPDNIKINNVKSFSRVAWGDGFHMRGTSNVSINDCFNRNSDDCIAIYASRRMSWDKCVTYPYYPPCPLGCTYPPNVACDSTSTLLYKNRDALNIKVTNTILYADAAHAIEIGWHGNQLYNNGKDIYNLHFENIDILEHDSKWVQQNGELNPTYEGAIGINCADDNKCTNFLFKKINIEDFTAGSLFAIRVMPFGEGEAIKSGKHIQNIRFEELSYTGSGENKATILGLDCERFVNGVHFENFKIRSNPSTSFITVNETNMLNYINTNEYAYNITFQEANNYSTILEHDAVYTIINSETGKYLKYNDENELVTAVSVLGGHSIPNNLKWKLIQLGAHYKIKPLETSLTLENTLEQNTNEPCSGRLVKTIADIPYKTFQEWKINPTGITDQFTINNAYTRAYLENIGSTVIANPKKNINSQKWLIEKVSESSYLKIQKPKDNKEEIIMYPSPANDYLYLKGIKNNEIIKIFDINGKLVIEKKKVDLSSDDDTKIHVSDLTEGIYIVKIENDDKTIYSDKFIKNR